MMNTCEPSLASIHFPSAEALVAPYQPQNHQGQLTVQDAVNHNVYQHERTGSSCSYEDHGHRLLSMLNDVLPLVDQDPEMLALMEDVTRLVCDYQ